jgi:DNA primase
MPIPEETIQQILGSTDIIELIEGYFPLQKKGQDYWACCPFHSEKTPSFKVSASRQGYYCFGCQAKGNAIGFVMEYESIDFPSAVRRLADRAGIAIKEDEYDKKTTKENLLKKKIIHINQTASLWFHENLLKSNSAEARAAREYLKERKIDIQIAKNWTIGLAPENGNIFINWCKSQGFNNEQMVASGLMSYRDQEEFSKGVYSRFRNRIMFPLHNDYGDTIAFSGRVFTPQNRLAKYVNSPETLAFKKSNVFFGLNKSKRSIAKKESAIICEGQLDLIRCFENGIENVVAPLGTALTEKHVTLLKRFIGQNGEVVLCFDSDSAGYKASLRAYEEISKVGVFIRALQLPDNHDPDLLITNYGPEKFIDLVKSAKAFHEYQIETLSGQLNLNNPRDRIQFANELSITISQVNDPIARDGYINDVAIRIGISADEFRKRVVNSFNKKTPQVTTTKNEPKEHDIINVEQDVEILIKLSLTDADTKKWIRNSININDELKSLKNFDLLSELFKSLPSSEEPEDINAFISSKDSHIATFLNDIIMKDYTHLSLVDAKKSLIRLKIKSLQEKIDLNKTFSRREGISNEEILTITSKVESQRKELLDFKKALTNIDKSRD